LHSFSGGDDDPLSASIRTGLPHAEIAENWQVSTYSDEILCWAQCRLFQDDVCSLLQWEMPRRLQLSLLTRLLLFHMCTHLLKMALLADDLGQKMRAYISTPEAHRGQTFECVRCVDKDAGSSEDAANACRCCPYHPRFPIVRDARSQRWFNALVRYHENVAALLLLRSELDLGRELGRQDILNYLSDLHSQRIAERPLELLLDEMEEYHAEHPPRSHAWDFFRRFACLQQETCFATQPRRGAFGIRLPRDLALSFSHAYIFARKESGKPPFFTDFLRYIEARGFMTEGAHTRQLEGDLRATGLMQDYADMGAARTLKHSLPLRKNSQ